MFTIGSFAELTGVSAKRLRHYHRIGLFAPAVVDGSNGYRYYTATQILALRRIVSLSELGVPLRSIRETVDTGREAVEAALSVRRQAIVAERAELDRKLAALDIELELDADMDVIVVKRSPGRWASIRTQLEEGADLGPLFVEAESVVLAQGKRAHRPPAAIDHGSVVGLHDVEVLIPTSGTIDETESVRNRSTRETQVAATLVRGEYPTLADASSKLTTWAETVGYRVAGPAWVVYLQFSAEPHLRVPDEFLTDRPDYVSEIQVAVS